MKIYLVIIGLMNCLYAFPQPNCNIYPFDDPCYEACKTIVESNSSQGSRTSQLEFNKAIEACPAFAYAYFEKAVPYLKRGDFVTWKILIDQAVDLKPLEYLGYRGWCRFQFVRDYPGALVDFEKLNTLVSDMGYSITGEYHLNMARALCYKATGNKSKAIEIMEQQLAKPQYSPWAYDLLHLGVLKMEVGEFDAAILCLETFMASKGEIAEAYYYLGLTYKQKKMMIKFEESMKTAKALYLKGQRRFDAYAEPVDKVFLSQIEFELKK